MKRVVGHHLRMVPWLESPWVPPAGFCHDGVPTSVLLCYLCCVNTKVAGAP